jgi:hypothetical protein
MIAVWGSGTALSAADEPKIVIMGRITDVDYSGGRSGSMHDL